MKETDRETEFRQKERKRKTEKKDTNEGTRKEEVR